ncbi:MAG TPA: replicative DNA helicase [Dehalococcoidia bacterium]|nr:replicative DNA helicase [Dehalococcoidia bacterium]
MVVEKLPPHDTQAEEAVVASLLVDSEAIYKVSPLLKPEDFFREQNRWVFEACHELWQRGEAVNQITVAHELARTGRLDEIGGMAYLSQLIGDLPTPLLAEHYARLVQRDSIYRNLISAAQQIAQIAYKADDPDIGRVLAQAEALIATVRQGQDLRDFVHIRDLLDNYQEMAAALTGPAAAETRAITTGFMDLDTLLLGGLKRSDLIIVAARTGLGKTSLLLNLARNAAARQKATVALFSLEMATEQLVQRLLAMESGVDSAKIGAGILSDRDERLISQAVGRLADTAIFIDDSPLLSVPEMRAKARRLQAERGLDLLVVDYLQLMQPGMRVENRVQEVSYISRSLKAIARDLDVPVVAAAQLSRAADTRATHVPQLSDLRESGSIEQDADVVMFVYREAAYLRREEWEEMHRDQPSRSYPAEDAQIIVAKHRNGPTSTIHLRFRQKISRFEDLLVQEPEEWEEEPA